MAQIGFKLEDSDYITFYLDEFIESQPRKNLFEEDDYFYAG